MPRKNPVVATTADDVAIETRFDRSLESGTLTAHITIQVGKEPLEIWINKRLVTTLQPKSGGKG